MTRALLTLLPDAPVVERRGWRYAWAHVPLRIACATVAMIGLCGWALQGLAPALAREQFDVAASKVGTMERSTGSAR